MKEEELKRKLSDLDNCTETQSRPGNWNYSPYMRGLANGLILAQSIMKGIEPIYFEEPDPNPGYIKDHDRDLYRAMKKKMP